jgi:hypothetical protein
MAGNVRRKKGQRHCELADLEPLRHGDLALELGEAGHQRAPMPKHDLAEQGRRHAGAVEQRNA